MAHYHKFLKHLRLTLKKIPQPVGGLKQLAVAAVVPKMGSGGPNR